MLERNLGGCRLDRDFLLFFLKMGQSNILLANPDVNANQLRTGHVALEAALQRWILLVLVLDSFVEAFDVVWVKDTLDLALWLGCIAPHLWQVWLRIAAPNVVLLIGL